MVGLAEKIRHYRRSVELLEDLEPDAPLVHRLRTESDRLDTELTHHRLLLFAADKISNTRALRLALARNSDGDLTRGSSGRAAHHATAP